MGLFILCLVHLRRYDTPENGDRLAIRVFSLVGSMQSIPITRRPLECHLRV